MSSRYPPQTVGGGAGVFVVVGGGVDDFFKRCEAGFALGRVGVKLDEGVAVAGAVGEAGSERGDGFFLAAVGFVALFVRGAEVFDEVAELGDGGGRFGVDAVDGEPCSGRTSHRNLPRAVASSTSRFWAALPMPRAGWLMIRMRAGSSCGLSITFK